MLRRFVTLMAVSAVVVEAATLHESLQKAMQTVVDAKAEQYKCAISAAVRLHNGTEVAAVAGDKDYNKKIPASVDDKFVWGSVTKTVTGSSIMRAAQDGLLKLTDSIVPHIDPLLKKMAAKDSSMNFSSLEEIFGPKVKDVTIDNLARMRSGIPDYDTATVKNPPTDSFRALCYNNSGHDYTPQEILGVSWVAKGHLDFDPNTKYSYSSTNFVLLGLVLAQLYNETWETFDQGYIIPHQDQNHTVFALTGSPHSYTPVHGYDRTNYNGNDPNKLPGIDISTVDCVYAGWTASDYTATVQDAANWIYDVYGSLLFT